MYKFLQHKLGGKVTLELIAKIFDASKHPEVLMKTKTEEEAFTEYIKSWGNLNPFQEISEPEFLSFYSDLSGCIDRNDAFEKVLKFPFNILL